MADATGAAMARGIAGADEDFVSDVTVAVRLTAERLPEFTVGDVWETIEGLGIASKTHDYRVLGGILKSSAIAGVCESTGEYRYVAVRECNASPRAVWRSRVHQNVEN